MTQIKKILTYRILSNWALFLTIVLATSTTFADINPAVLENSSWSIPSTTKTSVQKLGSTTFLDIATFDFLPGSQFELSFIDEETAEIKSISGFHTLTTAGLLSVTQNNLHDINEVEDFIDWVVEEVAEEVEGIEPEDIDILNLQNITVAIIGKIKQTTDNNTGIVSYTITLTGKISARADAQYFDYDNQIWVPVTSTVTATFKGATTQDYSAYAPSNWLINSSGAAGLSLNRAAKTTLTDNDVDIILDGKAEGFAPASFEIIDGDGESFTGTYYLAKSNFVFTPDLDSINDYIYGKILDYLDYDTNAIDLYDELWLTKFKASGKVKTNKKTGDRTITLSVNFSYAIAADLYRNGFYYDWTVLTGAFSFKGSGPEIQ